jgi:predicted amidohydrolase YtcJ
VKPHVLNTPAPAAPATATAPAALLASGVASNATVPPVQGGQGLQHPQQQHQVQDHQQQQQQLLQQLLGQEMRVKVHCAADSSLVTALNDMSAIALSAISGSNSSTGPQQQQQQQQQQVLLLYLQLEMPVKAHCAADVGLVQALNAMCAIAMSAITRQGA